MGADRKFLLRQKLNAGSAWGLYATFSLPTSASFLRPIQWRTHTALSLKLKWPSWLLRCSFKVFWLLISHQDHSGIQSGIQSGFHLSIHSSIGSFIHSLAHSIWHPPPGPRGVSAAHDILLPAHTTDPLTDCIFVSTSILCTHATIFDCI